MQPSAHGERPLQRRVKGVWRSKRSTCAASTGAYRSPLTSAYLLGCHRAQSGARSACMLVCYRDCVILWGKHVLSLECSSMRACCFVELMQDFACTLEAT